MTAFSLPSTDDRTVIVGSTGSGKTQFAVWLLSTRDWHRRAWFIFDYKGDDLISELPSRDLELDAKIPVKPGLYRISPLPGDEELVSDWFRRAWEQENLGIYIDEGYQVPNRDRWFRALLTQGRSKNIEMIVLSQRPVWLDKFVFTEASVIVVMRLNNTDDRKHVMAFSGADVLTLLPKYRAYWYDVAEQAGTHLRPVPDADTLLARFDALESGKAYV